MQSTLGEFQETQSEQPFALQNSKLLKVSLDQVTIQAKAGSMVAYQGDVSFEHAGSGGLSWMVKKEVTGEGTKLMKMAGTGDADLYVRFGASPTTTAYDCRPYATGNAETCTFNSPQAGTWYVRVRGYAAYSGVNLKGSY